MTAPRNAFRWQQGHWLALTDGTEAIENTLKETLRLMALRQKEDRQDRKQEYRHARQKVSGRFRRALERMDAAKQQEETFYARFGSIYAAFQRFYGIVNEACWQGTLPPCALHLSKVMDSSRTVAMAIRDFGREDDIPIPAQKTSSFEGIDWGSVTFGQLCRIGWGIFFPFIVSVILAALLIGAAVIAAFNGTIKW